MNDLDYKVIATVAAWLDYWIRIGAGSMLAQIEMASNTSVNRWQIRWAGFLWMENFFVLFIRLGFLCENFKIKVLCF